MSPDKSNMFELTKESEKELWKECVFVFDTSALLDFYDYPIETSKAIFSNIISKINSRTWIPAQVQYEYLKNRQAVIKKPIAERYEPLRKEFVDQFFELCNKSQAKLEALKQKTKKSDKHPFLVQDFIDSFQKSLSTYEVSLQEFKNSFESSIELKKKEIGELDKNDFVLESINKYFSVGKNYSFTEQIEICKEGKQRYDLKIPPGYEDAAEKIGTQAFGDLFIWKQIIDFASKEQKNIVFICNDFKTDWYVLEGKHSEKKAKVPRHELIKEFIDQTKQRFWMYSQDDFIYKCSNILDLSIPKDEEELISAHTTEKIKHFFKYRYYRAFRPDGTEKDGVNRIEFSLNGEEYTREYVPEGLPKNEPYEWASITEIDKHNVMYPNILRERLTGD